MYLKRLCRGKRLHIIYKDHDYVNHRLTVRDSRQTQAPLETVTTCTKILSDNDYLGKMT